jgi:hypothetical protein
MRTGFGGGREVVDLKLVTPNRLLSILVEVGHQLCCYICWPSIGGEASALFVIMIIP